MTQIDEQFMEQHGLNPEDTPVPEGLPEPLTWHVLVMPVQPKKESAGGIILAAQTQDAESHLQFVGKVVAMGPLCGEHEKFKQGDRKFYPVQVGDWVIYGRYAGQRCEYKGVRLLLLNDDEILAKAQSAEGFKIYV